MKTHYVIFPWLLQFVIAQVQCFKFDRNLVGVRFDPYVKYGKRPYFPPRSNYTFENLKTMLEIVSTIFTRVLIVSIDGPNEPYLENYTYYNTMNIRTRTAEAAALINCETKRRSLTVLIGAYQWSIQSIMEDQLKLAIEAAQIANSIYPGTVKGIMMRGLNTRTVTDAKFALRWTQKLRNMTSDLRFKIGLYLGYNDAALTPPEESDIVSSLTSSLLKEIFQISDFIVYDDRPSKRDKERGVDYSFLKISSYITIFRDRIKKLNEKLQVMWHTYWPGNMDDSRFITDSVKYWESVNSFAIQKRFPVWLDGAFDNPITSTKLQKGWWKLSRNELINNASGYIEKFSGKPVHINHPKGECNGEIYDQTSSLTEDNNYILMVLSFLASICVILVITCVIISRCRNSKKTMVLSHNDIHEFKFGHSVSQHFDSGYEARDPTYEIPYDESFEIPKERLKILWDDILGRGEFGFVYKANLRDKEDQDVVVAVKLPKQDCVSLAVKGLLSEIKILIYLEKHPNIVSICGACTAEIDQGVVCLALELCPLGSLNKYLRELKIGAKSIYEMSVHCFTGNQNMVKNNANLLDLFRWSHEIACGMEHLEKKNVIHADLATRNVLLTADKTAKVTDFGLSKRLHKYSNYKKRTKTPLPWRWLPLESLKRNEFSVKSDAWSYGVTVWEIYSLGDVPFPDKIWNVQFMKDIENGLRLRQPRNTPVEIHEMMTSCWNLAPEKRPSFAELCAKTRQLFDKANNKQ